MANPLLQYFFPTFTSSNVVTAFDTHKGQRLENQDNYLLLTPNGTAEYLEDESPQSRQQSDWSRRYYRLAIADGMGGHKGGRAISEALIQKLLNLKPQKTPEQLRQSLDDIHNQLWRTFFSHEEKSSGTTLIMADIYEGGDAVIANIGDSRALLWRQEIKQWQQLTYDQNLDEYDWRDGELEDEDYHPDSKTHRLAQAVGYGSFGLLKDKQGFKPNQLSKQLRLDLAEDLPSDKRDHSDVFKIHLNKGDAILLASDGLWNVAANVPPLAIPSPLELAQENRLTQFFEQIIQNGGMDNLSAVMLWSNHQ
jgi:serine/threonine protein phosphatase PrpC